MMLDHAQPSDAAGSLRRGAGDQKGSRRRADRAGAGGVGELRSARRRPGAQGAGERSRSWWKRRNCWRASRSKTTTIRRPPRKPRRPWRWTRIRCRARRFWPPSTGWRTRRKRLGSAHRQRLRDRRAFLRAQSPLRRGHTVLPQGDRAGPAAVQRAFPAGHQPDAPRPERRGLQTTRTLFQQRLPGHRHTQFAEADGQLQELRHRSPLRPPSSSCTRRKRSCCAPISRARWSAPSRLTKRSTS